MKNKIRFTLTSSAYLIGCFLTTSCSYYLNGSASASVKEKAQARLSVQEGVALSEISKKPPETREQALPKFNERDIKTEQKSAEPTKAKESVEFTLANVRALALENNLDLKIAEIDPKIAATQVSEEEAKFDDLIFAKAKYGRKDTPKQNMDVVTFTPTSGSSLLKNETDKLTAIEQLTQILDMEAGIVIPLRTGAKVTLSSPFDEKKQFKGVPSTQYQNALRFSVSQPLLRDGGIDTNVAGIRIAKYEQQIIDVKTRLQSIRVLASVERAYWAIYMAWGELDVRRQQYENASDNLEMVKKRVANGLTAAVELNRAEIGVAERRESLIVANTALKIRQRQLKLLLNDTNLNVDSQTLIIPKTSPTLLHFEFDRSELVQKALSGRLELLELELKLAANLTKIDYLKNQTLPLFMLDYNYGSLGRDTGSFDGAFNQAIDGNYSDWSVGMRVEIPLSNELRKSKLERAVQERVQRLSTQQLRELTVKREIYDALDTTEQNWQRILAARQNVILAGLNYDAELKQFREGLRTMTEVLETLTRLGDAQLREVRAISDYQVSLIDLAFATGTLLGHSRVQ
jgi:outer membrane protein